MLAYFDNYLVTCSTNLFMLGKELSAMLSNQQIYGVF